MLSLKRVVKYDGKSTYEVRIAGLTRQLPIVSIGTVTLNNTQFKAYIASDAELILGDVEFIVTVARELAKLIITYTPDVIVAPEAKAVALAFELSKALGIRRFVIIRKDVKDYMKNYIIENVRSITTQKPQRLVLDYESARYINGKKVCIVDDVVSTGSTIMTMENIVKRAGGHTVCRASIWVEGPWISDDYVIHMGELPIFIE